MRSSLRLLASVQRSTATTATYLEPGAPTGITGLATAASPRSTLLYLYHSTLQKLAKFPAHSVYRQSTEALTKQRMAIVESTIPAGLAEWHQRIAPVVEANPKAFRVIPALTPATKGEFNIVWKDAVIKPNKKGKFGQDEWDGEKVGKPFPEGPGSIEEKRLLTRELSRNPAEEARMVPKIEAEPRLTAEQINEMESKIGAGLIEEVIQVAEGEAKLADVLLEAQV